MSQSKFRETLLLLSLFPPFFLSFFERMSCIFEVQYSMPNLYLRPAIWGRFACVRVEWFKYTSGNKS